MQAVILVLSLACSAVSLVCWIMTLVKFFQKGDTLMGILSICPLIGFIMGWVKVKELPNHQNFMLAWTAAIVLNIILSVAGGAMGSG